MKTSKIIFALSSNPKLAKRVAELANVPLGESQIERFSDGEIIVRCLSDVKDKDVYVIQSTIAPTTEKIFELLVFIDALKSSEAKSINLVLPYYGYSRQDRVAKNGEPITARLVAQLYQSAGISSLITIDLHTEGIARFYNCPMINLEPTKLYSDYFHTYLKEHNISEKDLAIVTPDHGSDRRVKKLAEHFKDVPLVFVEKHRPAPNKSVVVNIEGEVKDKVCLLIDDIIDTGGTINNVVDVLFIKGAKDVYVAATHAVFSRGNILDKRISHLLVTDTIEKEVEGVTILSVAELIADTIKD